MATGSGDTTDARGGPGNTGIISSNRQDDPNSSSGAPSHDHRYKMNHARRGLALIINNETFHASLHLGPRTGTDIDAANMRSLWTELGFTVRMQKDCTASQMKSMLIQAARESHSDADCIVVVILSHGEDEVVYGTDAGVKIQDLVAPIKSCRSLAGKPKLFFLQACRGKRVDDGVEVVDAKGIPSQDEEEDMETNAVTVQTIPVEADFLMAYSVVQGYYSWRNTGKGSWFVQALVEVVRENWRGLDLLTMMTRVARKVAYDFQSSVPGNENMDRKKQIPCITSMLTKDLYFEQK